MATSTHSTHDAHSTTAGSGWSTRRIAVTALFCALSLITSFIEIPIFPPAPWLEYDPSCVLAFGPATGAIVAVLSWLVHLVFQFSPWGVLMAIAANVSLVVPCSLIARKLGGKHGLAAGMAVGAAISLAVCIVMNLIVTPLYTAVTVDAVVAMILPILVPFNVLKLVLNCALTALVQGPVSKALAG